MASLDDRVTLECLKLLWQFSPDSMFIIKKSGDEFYICDSNPVQEKALPQGRDFRRIPLSKIIPEENYQGIVERYHRCLKTGLPLSYEEAGIADDYWYTLLVPLQGDDSTEDSYIAGVSRNIKELKQTQSRLKQAKESAERLNQAYLKLNAELELRVEDRTKALAKVNQNLGQLANDLQEANEAKTRFLANMSHEIRTPLTAIIGYADGIIAGDLDDSEIQPALQTISQNGTHLLSIINDVLDLTKIESNKLDIESIDTEFFDFMAQVDSFAGKMARDKGLAFEILFQFPLPTIIKTDPTRLRQILFNLINNAVKFTDSGFVTVTVSSEQSQIFFAVRDSGIGMSVTQQKNLFQAFNQADNSISRRYGGTGLGLNISKNLSERLGGYVQLESEQGKGTTFTASVACVPSEGASWVYNKPQVYKDKSILSIQSISLTGNVLLAEDHPDNRALITRLLERMNLDVTAVDNGSKAVEKALVMDYDLILLDIQMPVMDGLEAFDLIQQAGNVSPIIALTANAMKHEVDHYLGLGFTDHLAKPIDRKTFAKKIIQHLDIQSHDDFDLQLSEEEMGTLKKQFLKRLVHDIEQITDDLQSMDMDSLAKHAHALKGSSGCFGYELIHKASSNLEQAAINCNLDAARQWTSNIEEMAQHALKQA
ncbi:hybrid sensor histidine kinase/response regulator [Algicola sagamiensis]|uniref:hybrid sensor histidine kinase/response regulator n=1 Tax=Algicola sagamiensis TaxID=163869 RepID=UPI0003A3D57F|nr:hybrid sensor histidine kinase/response regulator [Algicola sagamiensis]